MRNLTLFTCVLLIACNGSPSLTSSELHTADSLKRVRLSRTADSIIESARLDSIALLKVNKVKSLKLGDKTITLISSIQLSSLLRYEYEYTEYSTYYRERKAERDENFVFVKFRLKSESKWDRNDLNFLPKICLYSIDKETNKPTLIMDMNYQLAVKDDTPSSTIEEVFNYKEAVELIAWAKINKSIKDRLIVSANMAESCNFNRNAMLGMLNF